MDTREAKRAECNDVVNHINSLDNRNKLDKDIDYCTSLIYAIMLEQFEVAKQLIKFGADVSVKNDVGRTALQYAVTTVCKSPENSTDLTDAATTMMRCQSNFDFYVESKHDFRTSGVIAIAARDRAMIDRMNGHRKRNGKAYDSAARLSLVKTLLNAGADVNSKDYFGGTPLQCAVYTADLELLTTLVDAGADINSRNVIGATALHNAVFCSNNAMVRLLLSRGADVNVKTCLGNTPLHWAALLHRDNSPGATIKMLLDCSAEVNSRNLEGRTPFHYVMCNLTDDSDTMARFMELGADINAKDVNGATPFSLNDPELPVSPVNIEERRIIIEHVAAIEARTEEPVFDDCNLAVIKNDPAIESFYEKCRAELNAMKKYHIGGSSFTHLKILTEPLGVLSRYGRNKKLLKRAFKESKNSDDYQTVYPVYGSQLKEKLYATIARRKMIDYKLSVVDQVSRILSRMLQIDAPDVFFEIVFKYLSKEDIKLLINRSVTENA